MIPRSIARRRPAPVFPPEAAPYWVAHSTATFRAIRQVIWQVDMLALDMYLAIRVRCAAYECAITTVAASTTKSTGAQRTAPAACMMDVLTEMCPAAYLYRRLIIQETHPQIDRSSASSLHRRASCIGYWATERLSSLGARLHKLVPRELDMLH